MSVTLVHTCLCLQELTGKCGRQRVWGLALCNNRAVVQAVGWGKGYRNRLRTASNGLPEGRTIKTEEWEGASHAKDGQKSQGVCEGYCKKEVGTFEDLKIGQCVWSTVAKGTPHKTRQEGEGQGPACEGAFQAMIRSLDSVLNSVCNGKPLQGFI